MYGEMQVSARLGVEIIDTIIKPESNTERFIKNSPILRMLDKPMTRPLSHCNSDRRLSDRWPAITHATP
jgi:hypothetical protein